MVSVISEQDVPRPSYIPDDEGLMLSNIKGGQERLSLGVSGRKSIRETNARWVVLFLGCFANFGVFFCLGNPQSLQAPIEEIFQIQDTKFNLLQSVTSLPNIVVPFIGGNIIDKLGARKTMVILASLVCLGQTIVTIGASVLDFNVMVLGRFILGIGGATLELGLLTIIARWFLNREMSLAWGIARTILRLGNALCSFLTPKLYVWTGQLYFPLLFGAVLTVLSLFCLFGIVLYDQTAEAEEDVPQANFVEKIMLKDILTLPKTYFLIMTSGVLVYTSFIGLTSNLNNIVVKRFGFTSVDAGSYITIIYLVAGALSPIVGLIVDRVGRRVNFLMTAVVIILSVHILFILLPDTAPGNPNYGVIFGFVGLGIYYSIFATNLWPCIPLIVEPRVLGSACGFMSCLINLGITVFMEILGLIHDNTLAVHSGYFWTQIAHCGIICIALISVISAYYVDKRGGGLLHKKKMRH